MNNQEFNIVSKAVSAERIGTYLTSANHNKSDAIELYFNNIRISANLYNQIHWLEIIIRNAINTSLKNEFGQEWYKSLRLEKSEFDKLESAIKRVQYENKKLSDSTLVSYLTFGFWVNLFRTQYEDLWRKSLRKIFITDTKINRKEIWKKIYPILKIRNRIAHYEPIYQYPLERYKSDITNLIALLNPEINSIINKHHAQS